VAANAAKLCAAIEVSSPWDSLMATEPGPQRTIDGDAIDDGLRAIAHFSDLKSRFTRGHSTGVANRAAGAARRAGLTSAEQQTIYRAGLLHDVGRVAISAAVWDKVEPLTDAERERIRVHSYIGERILSRAPALAAAAEIATLTHERLDGTGYHRRLPAVACSPAARILAAADVYQALTEERPHRPAFDAAAAARELNAMATAGALCPDAVAAVVNADREPERRRARPSALSDREVEVLRLVARGLTNKEVASALGISTKTAGHHLQHIFEKLGVTTRAAATMVAMQRGLVEA
jgi:HD-GYP domain-containing protein (c-di-GMP phosphodiesterase class II)